MGKTVRAGQKRIVWWLCVAAVCAAATSLGALRCRRHLALAAAGPRADRLVNQGRFAEAEALLRHALKADPGSFGLRDRLADVLLFSGRQGEALAQRRRALACNPHNPEAYQALADTCDLLGRYDDAAQALEHYLTLWPEDPYALHVLAYSYERGGQPGGALDAWGRLLRVMPGHFSAQRGVARLGLRPPFGQVEGDGRPADPSPVASPLPGTVDLSDANRSM